MEATTEQRPLVDKWPNPKLPILVSRTKATKPRLDRLAAAAAVDAKVETSAVSYSLFHLPDIEQIPSDPDLAALHHGRLIKSDTDSVEVSNLKSKSKIQKLNKKHNVTRKIDEKPNVFNPEPVPYSTGGLMLSSIVRKIPTNSKKYESLAWKPRSYVIRTCKQRKNDLQHFNSHNKRTTNDSDLFVTPVGHHKEPFAHASRLLRMQPIKEDGTDGADVVDSVTDSEDKTFDLQGRQDSVWIVAPPTSAESRQITTLPDRDNPEKEAIRSTYEIVPSEPPTEN